MQLQVLAKRAFLVSIIFFCFTATAYASINFYPEKSELRQLSFELGPNESKRNSVVVENITDKTITVDLYGADGTQSNLGTFALSLRSFESNHIGNWITLDESTIQLEPRGKQVIPFTIKLPEKPTPGVYSGGIAAELINTDKNEQSGTGVTTTARNVIKIFVSVPGEIQHSFEWKDFSYEPKTETSKAKFHLSYKNTGNTIIIAEQKIELKGIPALKFPTFDLATANILQGREINVNKKWADPPYFGFYKAYATVTFSEYDIINNKKIRGETITRVININFLPLIETVIILLLTLVLVIFLINKAIKDTKLRKSLKNYKVAKDETLQSIAEKTGTNWKIIAKINKLKPPYTIIPGQKILLPPVKKK